MFYSLRFQIIFLFIINTFNYAFGYSPSVESLFRNASNEEVGEKTVIANLIFEKKLNENENLQSSNQVSNKFYTKIIFGNFDKNTKKFIQLNFIKDSFALDDIAKVVYRNNANVNNLGLTGENIEGQLVYSVLSSLLNNNGRWLVSTLNKIGSDVKLNNALVNEQKIELLKKYQNYLNRVSKDDSSDEANPLQDTNPEIQSEINQILKQPFYFKSLKVVQFKEKNKFYWQIDDQIFNARFEHESRQIKYLKVKTTLGEMEFYFKDFILHNSKNLFPKEILIKDFTGNEYSVTLAKLLVIEDNSDQFRTRIDKYDENVKKNPPVILTNKPSFML